MIRLSHDPRQCHCALARTAAPVVLDIETTGLDRRTSRIVSVGLLVGATAFLLFLRSVHPTIANLTGAAAAHALAPLARRDLIVVGHNLKFDVAFLEQEGYPVGGELRDTELLLRLLDPERGAERVAKSRRNPRRDLRGAPGAPCHLNYRLKHVAAQLLGLRMQEFPGRIEMASRDEHCRYLASDLLGTRRLYEYLWPRLSPADRQYHARLMAPIARLLVSMMTIGVQADVRFINRQLDQLNELLRRFTEEHAQKHGQALGMNRAELEAWLFRRLGLRPQKWTGSGRTRRPSVDKDALQRLARTTTDPVALKSLELIGQYRLAASLVSKLWALRQRVDTRTGRIYSSFADRQATGRLSSTTPNLQQIAKAKRVGRIEVRSRNALISSPGYVLVAFDISQADVRVLAATIENFGKSAAEFLHEVRAEFLRNLSVTGGRLRTQRIHYQNPAYAGPQIEPPALDPQAPCRLADDFRSPGDFYSKAVKRLLGRPPVDRAERNRFKPVILSVINSTGAASLARELGTTESQARAYLQTFDRAYPEVASFKWLMNFQTALTGRAYTLFGRCRTATAHRWLLTEPTIKMLVTYQRSDRYWIECVPVGAGLRTVTTYVRRVWDARRDNRLIYDHCRGRLSRRPYRLFTDDLLYRLPYRNFSWRSIRRIRVRGEEADYEGFDSVARAAFNFICQAGTSDVVKLMMLRAQRVCPLYDARLLLQIHDELVFEAPDRLALPFARQMQEALQRPPQRDFRVPIVVEAKLGHSFGDLAELASRHPLVDLSEAWARQVARELRRRS